MNDGGAPTLLIKNADVLVTMDDGRRELKGASLLIDGAVIRSIGDISEPADEVVDARGCVVTPGLVNTHHHLFQTLTRAVGPGHDAQHHAAHEQTTA